MRKKQLAILVAALAAPALWAGPPGKNTQGSTTISISTPIMGSDSCLVNSMTNDSSMDSDSDGASSGNSLAGAAAMAAGSLELFWGGDVTLDITRHGKNGSVFQMNLQGSLGSGHLFALSSSAFADTSTDAEVGVNETVNTFIQAVVDAMIDIDSTLDIGVASVSLNGSASGSVAAELTGSASAIATTEASNSSAGSASSSASGEGSASATNSVYVQGANIEEFMAGLTLNSTSVISVDSSALASSLANSMLIAMVEVAAEARAEAMVNLDVEFCYDTPLTEEQCQQLVDVDDDAMEVAQDMVAISADIQAFAEAYADSLASVMADATVTMSVMVQYENLNGPDDLLTIVGSPSAQLNCDTSQTAVNTSATAEVTTSP
ncbi:hypothetical protein QP938_03770 [Porticoccaceae bacterium LTM1]|nr:hypothetical protein QP938_03770 [Porticoccaceae bacterium LTM1]